MELLTGCGSMTREIVKRDLLHPAPFTLIDVGCSGGIGGAWLNFGRDLRAVGIDPVVEECATLQAAEQNPQVRYEACFVGPADDHPFMIKKGGRGPVGNNPWFRTSSSWALELLTPTVTTDTKMELTNNWNARRLADTKLSIQQLCDKYQLETLDFIKVDVDGNDFDVLVSASEVFDPLQVLGVGLEVNFFGSDHECDHTFHNTDRFMRTKGFSLFGLSVRPYSHRDLPSLFCYHLPGRTHCGPPLQGDALYVRDLADPQYAGLANRLPDSKIIKLAALCELANLPDCAAEILNSFAGRLERLTDLESLRDLLVPQACPGTTLRYREYLEYFRNHINAFLALPPDPKPADEPPGLLKRTLRYVRRGVRKTVGI